ncbi:MAG: dihydrofolate reductase family protein [Verrucomicrobia bacterium]|nr:dihydrofolate reductase family protein [Verrucomicrobiota bacterium]
MHAKLKRPFVFLNMAMTLDGKTSTVERRPTDWTSKTDKRRLIALRATADAVMVGARTSETDRTSLSIPDERLQRARVRRGQPPHPLRVIVSGNGSFRENIRAFERQVSPILIFTSRRAPRAKLDRLARLPDVHVYIVGKCAVDVPLMLDILARDWKVKRLLCEGGASLNWSLFAARAVDEVFVTLCPRVFGGTTAPTLVDGAGFPRNLALSAKLLRCQRKGRELFLRYRILTPV